MKQGLLLLSLFLFGTLTFCQTTLSTRDKVKDFKYLYHTLKENYPYFNAEERMHGFNWLDNKKEYIERIKQTSGDSVYFAELRQIVKEMHSGHTDFVPTLYKDYLLDVYSKMGGERRRAWVDVLEQVGDAPEYWCQFMDFKSKNTGKEISDHNSNYSDTIIGNIAIMTINSFDYKRIKGDSLRIDSFLNLLPIKHIDNLIIDIQQNHGGAVKYWSKNIVSRLITDTITYISYPTCKHGSVNKRFLKEYLKSGEVANSSYNNEFINLPQEVLDHKYFVKTSTMSIAPESTIDFSGNIYLLVSRKVFSSAEGFAQFCKTTEWAKVVGEKTGGDGVGIDPLIIALPKSKLLLRYPAIGGLNHDGSFNYEAKTDPDIHINAENNNERLEKLIQMIKSN